MKIKIYPTEKGINLKIPMEISEYTYCEEGTFLFKLLTPKQAINLVREIQSSLFDWKKLTGKHIDDGG